LNDEPRPAVSTRPKKSANLRDQPVQTPADMGNFRQSAHPLFATRQRS